MTRAERRIRLLLHAWPVSDRLERGDEIVGTSLDLVPEGRTRIPLSLAVNLLSGGLRARWRGRPPVWRWLYYRFGGRMPPQWSRWLQQDLCGPGWRRRVTLSGLWVLIVPCASFTLTFHLIIYGPGGKNLSPWQRHFALVMVFDVVMIGVAVIGRWFRAPKLRDQQLLRHGFALPVEPDPPWPSPVWGDPAGSPGMDDESHAG